MYLVISNNEFLEENITKLFLQKGIEVSNDRNSKFYESINLSLKESILKIFIGDELKFSVTLPTNFESIFNKINDFLSLIFIKYENVKICIEHQCHCYLLRDHVALTLLFNRDDKSNKNANNEQ